MKPESRQAVAHFLIAAGRELNAFLEGLEADDYKAAVQMIRESRRGGGRVHVTGIGKPGHVAGYMASLLSSTGTPAYFLHGTEGRTWFLRPTGGRRCGHLHLQLGGDR